jgi:hypothetical protein
VWQAGDADVHLDSADAELNFAEEADDGMWGAHVRFCRYRF